MSPAPIPLLTQPCLAGHNTLSCSLGDVPKSGKRYTKVVHDKDEPMLVQLSECVVYS